MKKVFILSGLLIALFQGCGGSSTSTSADAAISGTAATGNAIAGGQVTANCNGGSGVATTATDGTYSLTISNGGAKPCLLRVTTGTSTLYSAVLPGEATANITPLTHLIVANTLGTDPSVAFANAASSGVDPKITAANLASSQAVVANATSALGVTLPAGVNPLTKSFVAASVNHAGDDLDVAIDGVVSALKTAGVSVNAAATLVATATSDNVASMMNTIATNNNSNASSTSTLSKSSPVANNIPYVSVPSNATRVSLAGNAYITQQIATETVNYLDPMSKLNGVISPTVSNWTSPSTVVSAYVYVKTPGRLEIGLGGNWAANTSSTINVTAKGTTFPINITGSTVSKVAVGAVDVGSTGYIKIDLQGVSTTGSAFPDITALYMSGAASTDLGYGGIQDPDPTLGFYWVRRGPSTHMNYYEPSNTAYFYNEVTIPTGFDPIGSYFMSNGFSAGYFGIQVKSSTSRWVLFSVWDPAGCVASNPSTCTSLVSKGSTVISDSFGGEGTGGQSHLEFPWVAGNTYKFITRAVNSGADTLFSSWFYAPEQNQWFFIATFRYPGSNLKLTNLYSFNECFLFENSYLPKKMILSNQWTSPDGSNWTELTGSGTGQTKALFSTDATGASGNRLDFAGGLTNFNGGTNNAYYLSDGGFFNNDGSFNSSVSALMNVNNYTWVARSPTNNGVTSNGLMTLVQNLPIN